MAVEQATRTLQNIELKPFAIDFQQGDGRHAVQIIIERGEWHFDHGPAALRYLRFRFQVITGVRDRIVRIRSGSDGTVDADGKRDFSSAGAAREVARLNVRKVVEGDVALKKFEQKRLGLVGDDGESRD